MRLSPREYLRPVVAGLGLTVVAGTLGCDIPTSAPRWNTTWQVPADSAAIAVASLLPPSVSVVDVGGTPAFAMDVPAAGFSRSLGEVCPPCVESNGMRVPKPEFTMTGSPTLSLPVDVAYADIIGGFIDYTFSHSFEFDPLRPTANPDGAKGWLAIRLMRGNVLVARDSVNGADLSLPPGVTRSRVVSLGASVASPLRIDGPLTVMATLYSPAGDEITMNTSQSFTLNAAPRDFRVSEASVGVTSRILVARESTVDLSGLGDGVRARAQSGAVILRISNPFAVEGTMSATLTAPGGAPVVKEVALPLGGPAVAPALLRVELTSAELDELLGRQDVAVVVSGNVVAPSGQVIVAPTQSLVVRSLLEVILATTGN